MNIQQMRKEAIKDLCNDILHLTTNTKEKTTIGAGMLEELKQKALFIERHTIGSI